MIVDVGRRCRVSDMYFFTTGNIDPRTGELEVDFTRPTKVRWYNAPPGAKPLPFFAFGGADYLSEFEKCIPAFGETVFGEKKWSNGAAPIGATGQHFCGTERDFRVPKVWSPDLPTLERGPTGLPLCCNDALRNAIVWTSDPVVNGDIVLAGRISNVASGPLDLASGVVNAICPGNLLPFYLTATINTDVSGLPFNGASVRLVFGVDQFDRMLWSGSTLVGGQTLAVEIRAALVPATGKLNWHVWYGSFPPISFTYQSSNPMPIASSCSPFAFTDAQDLLLLFSPIGTLTLSVTP